jgi:hypothetical protein
MELAAYLAGAAGTVNLVMDLRITHERLGSRSNPLLNGNLHSPLPSDIDELLHEAAADRISEFRADYNNCPSNSISSMPTVARTSARLHCELVRVLFLQAHRETAFFCSFRS